VLGCLGPSGFFHPLAHPRVGPGMGVGVGAQPQPTRECQWGGGVTKG
jgi:hypothetical protein